MGHEIRHTPVKLNSTAFIPSCIIRFTYHSISTNRHEHIYTMSFHCCGAGAWAAFDSFNFRKFIVAIHLQCIHFHCCLFCFFLRCENVSHVFFKVSISIFYFIVFAWWILQGGTVWKEKRVAKEREGYRTYSFAEVGLSITQTAVRVSRTDFCFIKCVCHGVVVHMKNTMCRQEPTIDLSLSRIETTKWSGKGERTTYELGRPAIVFVSIVSLSHPTFKFGTFQRTRCLRMSNCTNV